MSDLPLNKFIVDEPPLLVFRSLVRALGLPEATFLQQLHYWLHLKSRSPDRYADHFIDGRYWVHWTYEEMRAEIPLGTSSLDTHKRVVGLLRAHGILLVEHHGSAWDRTNWYSISYEALQRFLRKDSSAPPSTGGETADALPALPPMQDEPSPPSTGGIPFDGSEDLPDFPWPSSSIGKTTDHKIGTETTSKTTTTTNEVTVGSGAEVRPDLDLDCIPEVFRAAVLTALDGVPEPQLFADLLAARLERDEQLAPDKRIGSPVLWLRHMLSRRAKIDYSPACAFAARRDAVKLKHRRAQERMERENLRERERICAHIREEMAASERVRSMSDAERRDLVLGTNNGQRSARVAAAVESAVLAGMLPGHPLACAMVVKTLRRPEYASPTSGVAP